jgi:hypothetical protein
VQLILVPLICHLPELKERPNYYSQKSQLPNIKEDLVLVKWSGELLDFNDVYSTILQDVCKRVEKTFERYLKGTKMESVLENRDSKASLVTGRWYLMEQGTSG